MVSFRSKNFWKYSRILEHDFRRLADTGDILLFKNRQFASQVQRLVTKSNYNHVAVVLRCSKGQIRFLEATSTFVSSLLFS